MTPAAMESTAVAIREHEVRAEDFLPVMTVAQAVARKDQINQFIGHALVDQLDYGLIPGSKKKCLLKPGAEKLCSIFGLAPSYVKEVIVEDWTGKDHDGEPLFSYEYRCQLYRGGRFMGEAIGSCNSWESKYRWRWIGEEIAQHRPDFENLSRRGGKKTLFEFDFALEKAETTGQYGKPEEYWQRFRDAIESGQAMRTTKTTKRGESSGWMITVDETQYRVPNPDAADIINTCQKMAQKRALVAACLVVTNCSDAFTQDMEDFDQPSSPAVTPVSGLSRPVPEELTNVFVSITKDTKNIRSALSMMENHLVHCGGPAGLAEYNRLVDLFRQSVPRGSEKLNQIKELLLDMWAAASRMEPPVATSDASPNLQGLLATMTDFTACLAVLTEMKRQFVARLPEADYYAILADMGLKHANEVKSVASAKKLLTALWAAWDNAKPATDAQPSETANG